MTDLGLTVAANFLVFTFYFPKAVAYFGIKKLELRIID